MRMLVCAGLFAFLQVQKCPAAEEIRLVLAPRSLSLTGEDYLKFDLYWYNGSPKKMEVPAPQRGFTVTWTLRDVDRVRRDRDGSHYILGTDTVKQYTLDPRTAIKCELGDRFRAEPGDILEFYITIDLTTRLGKTQTIRSNSAILYRSKENEEQR
jgi:hypothetical protein